MDEYELAPDSVFRVKAKKLLRGLARVSVDPDYARKLCKEFEVDFDESMIYTKDRYRELSDGHPRVDGEDLLIYICKGIGLNPNKEQLEYSNNFSGEGFRRDAVERAYLGRET